MREVVEFKKPKRAEDAAMMEEKRTCVGAFKGPMPDVAYYTQLQNDRWNKYKSKNLLFTPQFSAMKYCTETKKMIKRPHSVAKFSDDMTERF